MILIPWIVNSNLLGKDRVRIFWSNNPGIPGAAWGIQSNVLNFGALELVETLDHHPDLAQTSAVLREIAEDIEPRLVASGVQEIQSVIKALDGEFVQPGPSGAPTRGRIDVLPTGRNFYSVDNRTVPTPTAWELGRRSAELLVERPRSGPWELAQGHGFVGLGHIKYENRR